MSNLTPTHHRSDSDEMDYLCPFADCPGSEADDRHGHLDPVMQRIWRCVDPSGPLPEEGTLAWGKGCCWPCSVAATKDGYPHVSAHGGYPYVYRFVYEFMHGPIPKGIEIDHLCGKRDCLNPEHLEAVPKGVNIARSWANRRYRKERGLGPAVKRCADMPGYGVPALVLCA